MHKFVNEINYIMATIIVLKYFLVHIRLASAHYLIIYNAFTVKCDVLELCGAKTSYPNFKTF